MSTKLPVVLSVFILMMLSIVIVYVFTNNPPTSYNECLKVKGSLTQQTYPATCITPDGKTFTEPTADGEVPLPPLIASTPASDTQPTSPLPTASPECLPAGCSRQLCVPATEAAETASDCEFKPEYACVNFSTCEKQADGRCGWTKTPSYTQCLEEY